MSALDSSLLAAHARCDNAALVELYTQAANEAGTHTAQSFYLTHAYVFALESNHPDAAQLRARLVSLGCEDPD